MWEDSGVFPNGGELSLNSVNSGNLMNHWSMNWPQFKDPCSYMCLTGAVAASWSPTQEVAGLSHFSDKYFLSLDLLNSGKTFRKHSNASLVSVCAVGCPHVTITDQTWDYPPRTRSEEHEQVWISSEHHDKRFYGISSVDCF